MNYTVKIAFAVCCTFFLLGEASAEAGGQPAAGPGLLQKVEGAVTRGAKAAESGIERGAKAAARGADIGVKAAGRGLERGAQATQSTAERVANKVEKHVAPSASGK